jgi:hypothetical protein
MRKASDGSPRGLERKRSQAHIHGVVKAIALLIGVLLLAASASAQTVGRRVEAPFRFRPPDDRPASGLDEQKALMYRDQLRSQQREQQSRDIGRTAAGSERLRETQTELDRMDRILNNPSARAAQGRSLSSTPLPVPNQNPLDLETLGPVSGGARHQPTADEIKEREAARAERERKLPAPDLRPVFDLYGQRLQ